MAELSPSLFPVTRIETVSYINCLGVPDTFCHPDNGDKNTSETSANFYHITR
jgi:hypothetical protein